MIVGMGNTEIPEKAPFVVDEVRWAQDRAADEEAKQYPTLESVIQGFEAIGKPDSAQRVVKYPRDGKVYDGPFAVLTAQHCPIEHVAKEWPELFKRYVDMVEFFQDKSGSGGA
jgi:hypothetical protein